MCHVGMTEGTLRILLVPLEGLSSQLGGGQKYNPGKLHSWSQRGPLPSFPRQLQVPSFVPVWPSQRLNASLQVGAAKGKD